MDQAGLIPGILLSQPPQRWGPSSGPHYAEEILTSFSVKEQLTMKQFIIPEPDTTCKRKRALTLSWTQTPNLDLMLRLPVAASEWPTVSPAARCCPHPVQCSPGVRAGLICLVRMASPCLGHLSGGQLPCHSQLIGRPWQFRTQSAGTTEWARCWSQSPGPQEGRDSSGAVGCHRATPTGRRAHGPSTKCQLASGSQVSPGWRHCAGLQ